MKQDKITELYPYFKTYSVTDNYEIVTMDYEKDWIAPETSEDGRITAHKNEDGTYLYYSKRGETSFDDIFDFIKDTITLNKNISKKKDLFKKYVEELDDIFSRESIESLARIKIGIIPRKERSSKKQAKRPKKITEKKKEITENA